MIIRRALIRFLYVVALLLIISALAGIALILESKIYAFNWGSHVAPTVTPFPVGVNIASEIIVEQPGVNEYFYSTLANEVPTQDDWRDFVVAK
jgi:hypothetical protein